MPTIKILFDDTKVSSEEIAELGEGLRRICLGSENLDNPTFAFAYANSPAVKVNMEPIEVYILISQEMILDTDKLFAEIQHKLGLWKKEASFKQLINLTLMPMDWNIATDI